MQIQIKPYNLGKSSKSRFRRRKNEPYLLIKVLGQRSEKIQNSMQFHILNILVIMYAKWHSKALMEHLQFFTNIF